MSWADEHPEAAERRLSYAEALQLLGIDDPFDPDAGWDFDPGPDRAPYTRGPLEDF